MLSSRWTGVLDAALRQALLISAALHLIVFAVVAPLELQGGEAGAPPNTVHVLSVSTKRGPVPLSAGPSAAGGGVAKVPPAARPPALPTPQTPPTPATSFSVAAAPAAVVDASPVAPGAAATVPAAGTVDTVPAPVATPRRGGIQADPLRDAGSSEAYADALRGYRIALSSRAQRFYPPVAEEMGLGGRCEIEVLLLPSVTPELRIKRTSGHDLLDQAALKMLRRSVASVELPPVLKGRRFRITLPVQFDPPQ